MNSVLNMTKYFRDSNAAKTSINLNNKHPLETTLFPVEQGLADDSWYKYFNKGKGTGSPIDIIIVVKSIQPSFRVQEKTGTKDNEFEGVFFIPAVLSQDGKLHMPKHKVPWIARDYLNPILDKDLAIGELHDFDRFMEENYNHYLNISNWHEYFKFAADMFESVTGQPIDSRSAGHIKFDEIVYVLKDDMVNASRKILELYEHLLEGNWKQSKLYQNFMDSWEHPISNLIPNTPDVSKEHIGQMGAEYPLSPSQRESINHFNYMDEGDVLAVNGPPGTGKTTLLQSIVANMFVKHALREDRPPRIVGASANNRAVQNIVDSFGSIDKQWSDSPLEERWVENVHSFAVYFPSNSKKEQAKKQGYQVTTPRGDDFFEEIEDEENIEKSRERMLAKCSAYFQKTFASVEECRQTLHRHLLVLTQLQENLFQLMKEWQTLTNDLSMDADPLAVAKENLHASEESQKQLTQRYKDWEQHYNNLPIYYKWFAFLPFIKQKIQQKINVDLEPDEHDMENQSHQSILNMYHDKISHHRQATKEQQAFVEKLEKLKSAMLDKQQQLENWTQIELPENMLYSLDQMNNHLDTNVRYQAFWLAVHYYECRWIESKRLSKKQQKTNFENVLNHRYNTLSMIAPCYVMTFYKLPELAYAYDNGINHFLYNSIDLLIVDEAGQITPEIAACSFALAKRAVVVGDAKQIEPIWNITESLDYSLAWTADVAETPDSFEQIKEAGLYTAGSNVMQAAASSCNYQKHDERGLFLSEHRRCYDEIISYCNRLVYKNKLEPKRGKGAEDPNYPLRSLAIPHFGLKQIDTEASSTDGGSRYNDNEANAIADWLNENFEAVANAYPDKNKDGIIGVITPFKRQEHCIRKKLSSSIQKNVHVGTVHTFQGGELPVIILSTVYGKTDSGTFIDHQSNLLNVAVSRAKDSFLVFGDKRFMSNSKTAPSGLLKEMVSEF